MDDYSRGADQHSDQEVRASHHDSAACTVNPIERRSPNADVACTYPARAACDLEGIRQHLCVSVNSTRLAQHGRTPRLAHPPLPPPKRSSPLTPPINIRNRRQHRDELRDADPARHEQRHLLALQADGGDERRAVVEEGIDADPFCWGWVSMRVRCERKGEVRGEE